ncbi:hypothetical protein E2C01_032634 [Portunus trituberculatus]|uniref:Uncharacterized protein n=1 Tax=Portunus trituberculatus TaxID=210409 RepID=A0A5B7F1X5_PORTR|nr:hypothetical protein [Portunus trituberculatus]
MKPNKTVTTTGGDIQSSCPSDVGPGISRHEDCHGTAGSMLPRIVRYGEAGGEPLPRKREDTATVLRVKLRILGGVCCRMCIRESGSMRPQAGRCGPGEALPGTARRRCLLTGDLRSLLSCTAVTHEYLSFGG